MTFTSKPRVRIESDGTPTGTRVLVDDVPLTTVTKISWTVEIADHLASCTLELVGVDVTLTAEEATVTKALLTRGKTYEEVTD